MSKSKIGFISIYVESDGPCPGLYSMIEIGAVLLDNLEERFYANFCPQTITEIDEPIYNDYKPEALAVTGYTREQTLQFTHPSLSTVKFFNWLYAIKDRHEYTRLVMISDSPAFDWQWVNYYFYQYYEFKNPGAQNPLGHSARRIGDIFAGKCKNLKANFKHLRDTPHGHNPVNKALGNAEAFLKIVKDFKS